MTRLFAPVDIASLAYFHIVFGAIMLWEVWRYFSHDWISRYWIDPSFYVTYYGFDWVKPWAGDGMYLHFYALGVLAICIMIGFQYRISTTLFFLGFTYVFLLDESRYLNHFYLVTLISMLMIVIPAHRALSIDALLRPKIRSDTAPAWALWLLQAEIGIVYFYGGLAKLNADWLLRGEPMRMWLAARTDFPLVGSLFTEEWMVFLFAYGALLIDLLAAPMLLWRRTRYFAFFVVTLFHVMNSKLFGIGIFPWFMIAASLLFFPPEWPRQVLNFIRRVIIQSSRIHHLVKMIQGRRLPSDAGADLRRDPKYKNHRRGVAVGTVRLRKGQKIIVVLLITFLVLQLSIPLRHQFYPGVVHWTEEGHNFAWHMKLRDKDTRMIEFYATDPGSGKTWAIDPLDDLTSRQLRKMSTRPGMILLYSHHIADELRLEGYDEIEIRVKVMVSLNGREPQLLIDPNADLAAQPRTMLPAPWILPLKD